MSQAVVSIVVPLFNRRDFVQETISSVVNQTYPHWELIIVDDGSTDGGYELIERDYRDERIKLFRRASSIKGANVCRNEGVRYSTGEYIIFLDSDDLLAPFCLERRVEKYRDQQDMDFLVFSLVTFNSYVGDQNTLWNIDKEEDDLKRFLRMDPVWAILCPIYRKASLVKWKHHFFEPLTFWQDYDFHVRYLIKGARYAKYMQLEPDCFCRRHRQKSISQHSFGRNFLEVSSKKRQMFERIIDLLKETNRFNQSLRVSISVSQVAIVNELFMNRYFSRAYKLLIKLLMKRSITLIDFVFIALKLPLQVAQIKFPRYKILARYEQMSKRWVNVELNFPEFSVLRVQSNFITDRSDND